ncbi:GSCFA domain-containing protein [Rhodoflexus sp.]
MQFRTDFIIPPSEQTITHKSRLLLVGSCFADEVGQKLVENKFETLVNPFGTIFNPLSLLELLEKSLSGEELRTGPVEREGLFFHYGLHSRYFAQSAAAIQEVARRQMQQTADFLLRTPRGDQWLMITLGTAWIYELLADGTPVANCHKIPAKNFHKRLLQVEEIVTAFEKFYCFLPDGCRVLLTVSPVRHIKDTIPLNAVSKSVLRLAAHRITEKFPQVAYFPAYELLLDDLRDYRFYADDMIHPSAAAVNYIFEKFAATFFDKATQSLLQQWQQIKKGLEHRPLQGGSITHHRFLVQLLNRLEALAKYLDVRQEIATLRTQIEQWAGQDT